MNVNDCGQEIQQSPMTSRRRAWKMQFTMFSNAKMFIHLDSFGIGPVEGQRFAVLVVTLPVRNK